MPGALLQAFFTAFFIAVQDFLNDALEKEFRGAGVPVAQGGIHPVGGEVALPGVQPHDGPALAAGFLLTEGHHPPGQAPAASGGLDAEGVDDGHLFRFGGDRPGDVSVFRELDAVEVHYAPEKTVRFSHVEGPGLQRLTGGIGGGVLSPLPVGVDGTGFFPVQDGVINRGDAVQVGGHRGSDGHNCISL